MEKILVEKYFDLLVMLGHIGCLWWASATALCVTIIKMTLDYQMKKRYVLYFQGISVLIFLFFLSLIGYGIFCACYIIKLKNGILPLLPLDIIQASSVPLVFDMSVFFYLICTTSFVFLFTGWLYILAAKNEKIRKEKENGSEKN